jgi:hypothetical protein
MKIQIPIVSIVNKIVSITAGAMGVFCRNAFYS